MQQKQHLKDQSQNNNQRRRSLSIADVTRAINMISVITLLWWLLQAASFSTCLMKAGYGEGTDYLLLFLGYLLQFIGFFLLFLAIMLAQRGSSKTRVCSILASFSFFAFLSSIALQGDTVVSIVGCLTCLVMITICIPKHK